MNWRSVDSINIGLPDEVKLYSGQNDELPLRAWYVRIGPEMATSIVVSDDATDNRETVSSFAADADACVAVNGGYFRMNETPSSHYGLLKSGDSLYEPATTFVVRNDLQYPTARAAIGIDSNGEADIAWITTRGDTMFAWPDPPDNRLDHPAEGLPFETADMWTMRDALGAGPALVMSGDIRISSDEEVFFGTSIPEIHPRTAAGKDADGALLLMVVDGRQPVSRGVSLEELASLMLGIGATEALNLDGGGSSTLVVDGLLINRPAGNILEREVMSALVTRCR